MNEAITCLRSPLGTTGYPKIRMCSPNIERNKRGFHHTTIARGVLRAFFMFPMFFDSAVFIRGLRIKPDYLSHHRLMQFGPRY